jgi:hypothetical protein
MQKKLLCDGRRGFTLEKVAFVLELRVQYFSPSGAAACDGNVNVFSGHYRRGYH